MGNTQRQSPQEKPDRVIDERTSVEMEASEKLAKQSRDLLPRGVEYLAMTVGMPPNEIDTKREQLNAEARLAGLGGKPYLADAIPGWRKEAAEQGFDPDMYAAAHLALLKPELLA